MNKYLEAIRSKGPIRSREHLYFKLKEIIEISEDPAHDIMAHLICRDCLNPEMNNDLEAESLD